MQSIYINVWRAQLRCLYLYGKLSVAISWGLLLIFFPSPSLHAKEVVDSPRARQARTHIYLREVVVFSGTQDLWHYWLFFTPSLVSVEGGKTVCVCSASLRCLFLAFFFLFIFLLFLQGKSELSFLVGLVRSGAV